MFDWQVSEQGICQLDSLGGGRTGGGPAMTIHSDCGGRYRWPEWIAICDENSLVRSVSVKGGSHDGGEREGFFGGPRTSSSTIGTGLGRWTSRCSWLNSTRACATIVKVESRSPCAGRARTSTVGAWATRCGLVQGAVRISFRVAQLLLFA